MKSDRPMAVLALEDGKIFPGWTWGAPGESCGEVVFNTSMTGYQEVLPDPSYKGQIVTMTYPLIGNYGVNEEDFESVHPWVEGFAVKEICSFPSSWRYQKSLEDFLKQNGIVAIEGLDTRALTKHLRSAGALRGILSTIDLDPGSLVRKARSSPSMVGADWVQSVTCAQPYLWGEEKIPGSGLKIWEWGKGQNLDLSGEKRFRVWAVDCGMKHNIARHLAARGCELRVVPARTRAE